MTVLQGIPGITYRAFLGSSDLTTYGEVALLALIQKGESTFVIMAIGADTVIGSYIKDVARGRDFTKAPRGYIPVPLDGTPTMDGIGL